MNEPNEHGNGASVLFVFGAVFALLMALIAFQPKAGIWIADSVQSEFSSAPDQAIPIRVTAEPKRRPIEPGEWVKPLKKEAAN